MTLTFWTDYWYFWLLFVLLSWLVAELASVYVAKRRGEKNIADWTLSDTIRRWSAKYRWLAPVVVGTTAFLVWHFFMLTNK
jgi:cbb3-type cytochrome oxidase subunit 3